MKSVSASGSRSACLFSSSDSREVLRRNFCGFKANLDHRWTFVEWGFCTLRDFSFNYVWNTPEICKTVHQHDDGPGQTRPERPCSATLTVSKSLDLDSKFWFWYTNQAPAFDQQPNQLRSVSSCSFHPRVCMFPFMFWKVLTFVFNQTCSVKGHISS